MLFTGFSASDVGTTNIVILTYLLLMGLCLLSRHDLYFSDNFETKMFGFKITKMPLGIKLENQYATSIPDLSSIGKQNWL